MASINLYKEVKEASNRIESREAKINEELTELNDKVQNYTDLAWGFVWVGGIISLFAIHYFVKKNTDQGYALNLMGDFMGGTVASVWSLAGLFFIYVAFLGQKQQLLNQQLEIMYSQLEVKFTRLELAGQKEEMIEQNKTLRQQKFENTFFQLMTLFSSIVNSLDLRKRKDNSIISTGRDCFEIFYERLRTNIMHRNKLRSVDELDTSSIQDTLDAYSYVYSNNKADMSHYLRTIYHIIKFIDNSDIENKKQYISIARAQLSSYEQIIIFYNCLHDNGVEKFKPFIEKYAIFKNIDTSLLINPAHWDEYDRSAYGL